MNPSYDDLPGIHPSPNIQTAPDLYELENRAADPEQHVEHAMLAVAAWTGKTVLDFGRLTAYYKKATASEVTQFWREQGFSYVSIPSEWRFEHHEDLEKVVRLESGEELAAKLLAHHNGLRVSYHYKLYYRIYEGLR